MVKNMDVKQKSKDWRFERKFVVKNNETPLVEHSLVQQGYIRQFDNRVVNSIYFDNDQLECYYENLIGVSERKKYRMRFYGNDSKFSGQFEEKIKSADTNTKRTLPFYDLDIDKKNWIFPNMPHLKPLVHVSYVRQYFFNSQSQIRATIDTEICYRSILTGIKVREEREIIEFKSSSQNIIVNVPEITSYNIRNSKYCLGISSLGIADELY